MANQQINCNIGIIGDTQSGKTLFLSSLPQYSKELDVGLVGQDEKSKGWLNSGIIELKKGGLPPATMQEQGLTFELFWRAVKTDTIQRINIMTADRSGSEFANPSPQMIEYFLRCRGFIILINPNGEMKQQFDTISKTLEQIVSGSKSKNLLENRISVCLTQYDNPKFLKSAKESIRFANENGIITPLMSETNTFKALNTFFVANRRNYGNIFLKYLTTYWAQKGINYFSISSVGFYVYPDETKIDIERCTNIIRIGKDGKKVLRNGFDHYRPVHLLKPINWILETEDNTVNVIKQP